VSLLSWNHEPCVMDVDPLHLVPATLLRHRHLKRSITLGSAYHVISRPHWLHFTLLWFNPASVWNWTPMAYSVYKSGKVPSHHREIPRSLFEKMLQVRKASRVISWYCLIISVITSTIFWKSHTHTRDRFPPMAHYRYKGACACACVVGVKRH